MKRLSVILTCGLIGFLVIGADHRTSATTQKITKITKKSCSGYTVIEASKGIDCNGDTIKLTKAGGFYQRVLEAQPEADS